MTSRSVSQADRTAAPPTLGVLLAGGLARRMGGGDKPLRRLGGLTILERVIGRLRPQCAALILNANGDPARFDETGLPVVPDPRPDFAGPLAGILAALDWASLHRPDLDWVASVAADTPFLPHDLVERLHEAREKAGTPLACAESGGQAHPVNALWRVDLREDLRHALFGEDMRKIDRWTARHGIAHASWPTEPYDPFFNANAPEDIAEAERLLGRYAEA
jgi:molybdopterin-guanine dinucleotide biosynthesis protein A